MGNIKILGLTPSKDQMEIIETVKKGDSVFENSVAGSSKSTTFYMTAKYIPNKRFLLLTFMNKLGKETRMELRKHKINNVDVSTIHALAYKEVVAKERLKLINFIDYNDMKELLCCRYSEVKKKVDKFNLWLSNNQTLEDASEDNVTIYNYYIDRGEVTHSLYLKRYILKLIGGDYSSIRKYDAVVIDEINDANEAMVELQKQADKAGKQIIAVGDYYQSVMGFSLNGYSAFRDKEFMSLFVHKNLSMSFRCNTQLANFVQKFLNIWFREENDEPIKFEGYDKTMDNANGSYGIINRTNAGTVPYMVKVAEQGVPYSCTTEIDKLFESIYAVAKVIKSAYLVTSSMTNKQIKSVTGISDTYLIAQMKLFYALNTEVTITINDFIDEYMNTEYVVAKTVYLQYYGKLDELQSKLKDNESRRAKTIISTAHRTKGLTMDRVTIGGFKTLEGILLPLVLSMGITEDVTKKQLLYELVHGDSNMAIATREEFNLIYVAITRSRGSVTLSENGFKLKDLLDIDTVISRVNLELELNKLKRGC